jgi:hypothetical protein
MFTIFFPFYCNASDNWLLSAEVPIRDMDANSDVTNRCISIFGSGLGLTVRISCDFRIYIHHFKTDIKTMYFHDLITGNLHNMSLNEHTNVKYNRILAFYQFKLYNQLSNTIL